MVFPRQAMLSCILQHLPQHATERIARQNVITNVVRGHWGIPSN